jgi:ABC-type uncharacterized transport system auxiliary subunit
MKPTLVTFASMLVAIAVASCSMPSRAPVERQEFVLRARDADAIRSSTERAVIRVAPVELAPHVRGVAIVTEGGRVQTMVNQGFAAPINTMVGNAVVDRLRATGRYGVVVPPGHPSPAPVVLRLTLRAFEIAVTSVGYEARVVFDGVLERDTDRSIIRTFRTGASRPAEGAANGGFVRALEDALNAAIDALLAELEAAGLGGSPPGIPESDREDRGEPPKIG